MLRPLGAAICIGNLLYSHIKLVALDVPFYSFFNFEV
jgi:hypothetical protein